LAKANIESAGIEEYIKDAAMSLVNILSEGAQKAVKYISNISGFITNLVVTCVIIIYLLLDGRRVLSYISKVCKALLTEKQNKTLRTFVNDVDTVFSGYIRGQFTDAFVIMILIGIGLSIIGIEYAILIAILAGLGNLIPYVGPFIAYGGVILSSIIDGDMKTFIIAMIFLLIIQTIDGNVIGPKLLSNSIEVHPMLVVIFILFGSAIGGLMGMLFAVPVGALIKVIFVRFVDKRLAEKA
jgi:predicted PurR-regulated permease PerM